MKISRLAVPAMLALSLAACGSDSNDSTGGGTSSTARLQAFQKFSTASNHAAAAGATNASYGFILAGIAQLFGGGTATVTVGSNGQASLSVAGRPTQQLGQAPSFATAGSYTATAVRFRDISSYPSENYTDTTETNMIIAYRDTTALIFAVSDYLANDTFGETGNGVEGFIYESPNSEWYATAGQFNLGSMSVGSACSIDATIQQAIQAQIDDAGLDSWTCKRATFNATLNITGSTPTPFNSGTNAATGSRTASISASGLPGVFVDARYTYTSGAAARAGFMRHAR